MCQRSSRYDALYLVKYLTIIEKNVCIEICLFQELKLKNMITEAIAREKRKIAPFMR